MTQENKERYLDACPELLDAVLAVEEELGNEPCFDWNQEWKDVQRIVKELPVDMEGWAKGVQVMIEGPGHMPVDQIATNVLLEKKLCNGAPFYVLGPIVTDIAPGYDHITAAIGGALAASAGADFLCYVTPSEHLRLPTPEDVWEGVMASRIAAHAADLAKGLPGAHEWDRRMAVCRKKMDWKGQILESIDPERASRMRASSLPEDEDVCTMCAGFCAIKKMREAGFVDKDDTV
jgi:phosphomethylpyrimidine synthase